MTFYGVTDLYLFRLLYNYFAIYLRTNPLVTMKFYICLFALWVACSLHAQDYGALDAFLQKNVSQTGAVDYKSMVHQKAQLNQIYTQLTGVNPDALKSQDEKLAFWINLYNAATLKLITDKYPLKSITDLDGGKTWDVKRIQVGGKSYSLNDIENTKIRTLKDARIHFAVNCAAKSCPPLLNAAYTPAKLNTQLEAQTKRFINDPKSNAIQANKLSLSKIFEWYKEDFGNLTTFLNKYSSTKINAGAKIGYNEYDWSLNSK